MLTLHKIQDIVEVQDLPTAKVYLNQLLMAYAKAEQQSIAVLKAEHAPKNTIACKEYCVNQIFSLVERN